MHFRRVLQSAGFQWIMSTVIIAVLLTGVYFMQPGIKNNPAAQPSEAPASGTAMPADADLPATTATGLTQTLLPPSAEPSDPAIGFTPIFFSPSAPTPIVAADRVTITVLCSTALVSEYLPEKQRNALPADGILLNADNLSYFSGQSALDALRAAANAAGLPVAVNAPILGPAYLEGIGGLYEFDCGPLSGWLYRVNGIFPGEACSKYVLQPGDKVVFVYTCDMGRDVGGNGSQLG